jgi:hypothetical protein
MAPPGRDLPVKRRSPAEGRRTVICLGPPAPAPDSARNPIRPRALKPHRRQNAASNFRSLDMKKLFLTTALLSALTVPALAQTASDEIYLPGIDSGVRASDFIGKRVYVTAADTTGLSDTSIDSADADWEDVGEINDLMISLTGDTEAVLVDVGGFLGIGEKTVAVSLNQLTLVPDSASPDDYFIVFHGTKDSLTGAPAFDSEMVFAAEEPAADAMATDPAATDVMADSAVADPAATEVATADATQPADAAPMPGEAVDLAAWAESDLVGKRVYGPGDEDIGEISAVAMTADGKVDGAVVDVGGFLGIGEKKVALTSDMLQVVKEDDGTFFFRVNATQEQLEALAPYSS